MQCPKCNGAMEAKNIEDVEVDVCSKCSGVWFDQDEQERPKIRPSPTLIGWILRFGNMKTSLNFLKNPSIALIAKLIW